MRYISWFEKKRLVTGCSVMRGEKNFMKSSEVLLSSGVKGENKKYHFKKIILLLRGTQNNASRRSDRVMLHINKKIIFILVLTHSAKESASDTLPTSTIVDHLLIAFYGTNKIS